MLNLRYVIQAFLWTSVMLVGWCFNQNIPSYFSDVFRTLMFITSFIMYYLRYIVIDKYGVELYARGSVENTKPDLVPLFYSILQVLIDFSAPFCDSAGYLLLPANIWIRATGYVLFVVSVLLITIATTALDRNFSMHVTILEGHQLVTKGLFRVVRHPRYLGIVIQAVAVSLVFLSIFGLILSVLVLALFLWRIYNEECLMRKAFGERWDEYAKSTKRLIPFVF